ncbi:MAG: DNA repair protein RadC [Prolixibacteraceae bacterium]|jgi:DNA repair protein RadC|nr:DNA repair protein RadC [Prolixibacteraceae bacterium]
MAEYEKLSIKQWAVEDRPREKMLKHGFASLSNAELIAILIGSGSREESAVELSRRMLSDFQNELDVLGKASTDRLMNYKGMGEAKTINVLAALELGKRRQLDGHKKLTKITSSADVFNLFAIELSELQHEEFWILYLDRGNNVVDKSKISQGGISGTVIDVRIIMKKAIEKLVSSIILVHNHPSRNLSPSKADIDITQKTSNAAALLDIKVLDHVIVAGNKYTSFADEGML